MRRVPALCGGVKVVGTPNRYQKPTALRFETFTTLATRAAATGLTSQTSAFLGSSPVDIYIYNVGGFGVMGWVEAPDYKHATPDPLAEIAVPTFLRNERSYTILSLRCRSSREICLVSGKKNRTTKNCAIIIAAKKTNG